MHYLIQKELILKESRYKQLISVFERFKLPYSTHKVVPFVGKVIPDPPETDLSIVPFGYYSLRHTSLENGWLFFDLKDDDFITQRDNWGEKMLNYDSNIVEFVKLDPWDIQFLRPIDDSKSFTGRVFTKEDIIKFQKDLQEVQSSEFEALTSDTLVQQCSTKTIHREYRNWVINGRVVTSSQYKVGNRVVYNDNIDEEVRWFCSEVLNEWTTSQDAFCLDVCLTPDGFKIVEINTINSSGFYDGDLQKIIMGLEDLNNEKRYKK